MGGVVLTLLLAAPLAAPVQTSETPTTRVYVRTTPPGAEVEVDGTPQGKSDCLFVVPPGVQKMTLEVELDGHYPQRQEIAIRGGRITRVELVMQKRPAQAPELKPAAGPAPTPTKEVSPAVSAAEAAAGAALPPGTPAKLPITATEERVEKALAEKAAFRYVDTPFFKIVDDFKAALGGVQVMVDQKALEEAGFQTDKPITFSAAEISRRSALDQILSQEQLTWTIRGDVVIITTPDADASDYFLTKVYAVSDLTADREALRKAILQTIEPTSWEDVGGAGSLKLEPGGKATSQQAEKPGGQADAAGGVQPKPAPEAGAADVNRDLRAQAVASSAKPEAAAQAAGPSDALVVICADPSTPFKMLNGAIRGCQESGFRQFAIKAINAGDIASVPVAGSVKPEAVAQAAGGIASVPAAGSLKLEPGSQAGGLVIRQTYRIHRQIMDLLTTLRDVAAGQPSGQKDVWGPGLPVYVRRSAPQQTLLNALGQPATLECSDKPFADIVAEIQKAHKIPILLDHKGFEDMGFATDKVVTFRIQGVPLRQALTLLLRPEGLTWTLPNDYVLITIPDDEANKLLLAVYPIGQLIRGGDPSSLVETIQSTIAPITWDPVGGPGNIAPLTVRRVAVLVVSQTREVHEEIAGLFEQLTQGHQPLGTPAPKPAPTSPAPTPRRLIPVESPARLDFRIAPRRRLVNAVIPGISTEKKGKVWECDDPRLTEEELRKYREMLAKGATGRGDAKASFAWFACDDPVPLENLITGSFQGQAYCLLSNRPEQAMLSADTGERRWSLKQVSVVQRAGGTRTIEIELDANGARRLAELSAAHPGKTMAILVVDRVISIPVLRSKPGARVEIGGAFSEEEADRLASALRAGIRAPSPVPGEYGPAAAKPAAPEPSPAALLEQLEKAVLLSHVDDTAEGRRSIAGSGHAVAFQRPANAKSVVGVQLFGSRYGDPKPPDEDFHIYLLDEQQKVIRDVPVPYGKMGWGDRRWYAFEVPPTEVPERFYVAVAFDPHQTKGVYLGMDQNVKESHSYTGLPARGFEKLDEKADWMIRVLVQPDRHPQEAKK